MGVIIYERIYNGDALLKTASKNYRMWFRYSSEKLEARLGLQKIAFGPAQILRSLAWFDTIDPKDPTGQTAAVEAFRLRVYPTNSLSVWTWVINNELDTLAYGGRVELSNRSRRMGVHLSPGPNNDHPGRRAASSHYSRTPSARCSGSSLRWILRFLV